jgi:hypothetical protein
VKQLEIVHEAHIRTAKEIQEKIKKLQNTLINWNIVAPALSAVSEPHIRHAPVALCSHCKERVCVRTSGVIFRHKSYRDEDVKDGVWLDCPGSEKLPLKSKD